MSALEKAVAAAKTEAWNAVIAACQKAIDEAQKIQQGDLHVLFPDALANWVAGEVESQRVAMRAGGESFTGIHLVRRYTANEGGAVIEMTLSNWSAFRQGQQRLLRMKDHMPEMLTAMGISAFERDGCQCLRIDSSQTDKFIIVASARGSW